MVRIKRKRFPGLRETLNLHVIPLLVKRRDPRFDLFEVLKDAVYQNKVKLQGGDVLVVSSKFVSSSQNRTLRLAKVKALADALEISKKFMISPSLAEAILRESDYVIGGINGFVITSSDNILAPNAGIDKSNADDGIITYPANPSLVAEELRRKIFLQFMIHVGVIIVDSRLMPARIGTTGVALACAGMEPLLDLRATLDLNGRPLKVTIQAVADSLATIANHKMGEGSDSKPFAIVRDAAVKLTGRKVNSQEMAISPDLCVYVRGLREGLRFNT